MSDSTRINQRHVYARAGFTLFDVLVAISVIAILLALLTPTLSRVTESARRIVCASNMHQVGLGISMWVNDHDGSLPPVTLADDHTIPESPVNLQLAHLGGHAANWDGLGLLVSNEYLTAPTLFYCPSHNGENTFSRYESAWYTPGNEIVTNYHYRWLTNQNRFLDDLNADVTLMADGLRTKVDYNHGVGNNMLKADLRVEWFSDPDMIILALLPDRVDSPNASQLDVAAVEFALDTGDSANARPENGYARNNHISAGFDR